jgi:hypothetical protein
VCARPPNIIGASISFVPPPPRQKQKKKNQQQHIFFVLKDVVKSVCKQRLCSHFGIQNIELFLIMQLFNLKLN